MFADFRGRSVLILGKGAIAEAATQAFADRGAECLRTEGSDFAQLPTAGERVDSVVCCATACAEIESVLDRVRELFGCVPRYLIAVLEVVPVTDPAAINTAMIQAWCDGAAVRYAGQMNVNVIRYRRSPTEAARWLTPEHLIVLPLDVASAAVALCSGAMDAVRGQTLVVDRGAGFCDNVMRLYAERERWAL